jgi:predicted NBD/HSP70 family sugar kinase
MTRPSLPADQQTIRRHNLSLITGAVRVAPGSRAELAQRTGLTKATVSSLVDALLEQGILTEGEAPAARVGRPARPVSLNPDGPRALGLEINVDYLAACLVNLTGRMTDRQQLDVDNRARSVEQIIDDVERLCRPLLSGGALLGAALALPGVVGRDHRLLRAPNLPELTGQPVAPLLLERLAIPDIMVDNEANFGALGWLRGAGSIDNFVYVSGEIGVGSGLVVDGRLFRGSSGFAGELGHVVVERAGPDCACGGRGCVEQYAGQEVLLASSGQPDVAKLAAAVAAGEPRAQAAVNAAGSALGVGLASLLNVVDLPCVVLGGAYARLYDAILPSLQAELDRRVLSGQGTRLFCSGLGADAAMLGAAGAVVEQALRNPAAISASAVR